MLRGTPSLPRGEISDRQAYSRKRWRQVQYLVDVFWRRWLKEYIPYLNVRQKWHEVTTNLKPGDVVILVDDKMPRNAWQLGRVVEAFPSADELIRSVIIATRSPVSHSLTTLTRPFRKLCLLESCLL